MALGEIATLHYRRPKTKVGNHSRQTDYDKRQRRNAEV
jgi:hypothetical protein